ncbi:hypothetical protein LX32DRAFT_366409 [Colletotrichum zoysiae]|uniref:Uncharacterized protein n=1 Tax=Colletotrichum zoysiae TaxID=1216348 RepID=A0AAD9HJ83_9PEZI|nr:hypothetical protein LX32DRAFT_366409 [Colletotrichum zoysiae]
MLIGDMVVAALLRAAGSARPNRSPKMKGRDMYLHPQTPGGTRGWQQATPKASQTRTYQPTYLLHTSLAFWRASRPTQPRNPTRT